MAADSESTTTPSVNVLLKLFGKGFLVEICPEESTTSTGMPYVKVRKHMFEWKSNIYEDLLDVLFAVLKEHGLPNDTRVRFGHHGSAYDLYPCALFATEYYLNFAQKTLTETYRLRAITTEAKCVYTVLMSMSPKQRYTYNVIIPIGCNTPLLEVIPGRHWISFLTSHISSDLTEVYPLEITLALKHMFPGTHDAFVQFRQDSSSHSSGFTGWFEKNFKDRTFVFNSRKSMLRLEKWQ